MTSVPRPLAIRRGLFVPYVTAWSGEREVSRAQLLLDTGGLRYRSEHSEDRDCLGGLWERWTGDYGDGAPLWRAVNSERQRTAMEHLRCQVCAGPASRTSKGVLFLEGGRTSAAAARLEEGTVAQPPLCLPCAPVARRQRPHLRRRCIALRAKKYPVWGVLGAVYTARRPLGPRPTDQLVLDAEVPVAYGTPALRYVLASQLLRELRRVMVVDLDAELKAAGQHPCGDTPARHHHLNSSCEARRFPRPTERSDPYPEDDRDDELMALCTVTLHGGPLDGATAPVDVDPTDPDPWTAIVSDGCAFPGGRSLYAPDCAGRWVWRYDVPWDAL